MYVKYYLKTRRQLYQEIIYIYYIYYFKSVVSIVKRDMVFHMIEARIALGLKKVMVGLYSGKKQVMDELHSLKKGVII